jgi:hypothetical protein
MTAIAQKSGFPPAQNTPVGIQYALASAQMRRSQCSLHSHLRICAGRNATCSPVCAFAQVAMQSAVPSAQMRKSHCNLQSRLRICAGRTATCSPVCANAQVAVQPAVPSAHLRKSQCSLHSHLRKCAGRPAERRTENGEDIFSASPLYPLYSFASCTLFVCSPCRKRGYTEFRREDTAFHREKSPYPLPAPI